MRARNVVSVSALAAALLAACVPEDREPVLIGGGDGDAERDAAVDDASPCTGEDYPCGPYGRSLCDVVGDHRFVAANAEAEALAGGDGLLDMHDLFGRAETAILLYGTAGWCSACVTESRALNALYEEFRGRAEFVAVVFQDNVGNPATAEFAAGYAAQYGFVFPTVADTSGDVLYYFDAASTPGNIFIDATNMQLYEVLQGFDAGRMRSRLRELDGSVDCRR